MTTRKPKKAATPKNPKSAAPMSLQRAVSDARLNEIWLGSGPSVDECAWMVSQIDWLRAVNAELLAACEESVAAFNEWMEGDDPAEATRLDAAAENSRAAIAKATGKAVANG